MNKSIRLSGRVHQQDILLGATTLIRSPNGADYCELDEIHLLGRLHTLIPEVNQFCVTISRLIDTQPPQQRTGKTPQEPVVLGEVEIWRNQVNVTLGLTARQFDRLSSLAAEQRLASVTIDYVETPEGDCHELTYFQAGTDPDLVVRHDSTEFDRDYAKRQWDKEMIADAEVRKKTSDQLL